MLAPGPFYPNAAPSPQRPTHVAGLPFPTGGLGSKTPPLARSPAPPLPRAPAVSLRERSRDTPQSRELKESSASLKSKTPAALLAELQKVQDVSELEGKLLGSVTDLFDTFVAEDRKRRAAWEERIERGGRELRSFMEAEVDRVAIESRKQQQEAQREATEARRAAMPCQEMMAALTQEAPSADGGRNFVRLVQREAQAAAAAEVTCVKQHAEKEMRKQSTELQQMLTERTSRWADICSGQMADAILREREAWEGRIRETETRAAHYKEELQVVAEQAQNVMEGRISRQLQELHNTNTSLQVCLERYSDRWDQAWKGEAETRGAGDLEAGRRLQVIAETCDKQAQALESAIQKCDADAKSREGTLQVTITAVMTELETEARARQDGETACLDKLNKAVEQVKSETSQRQGHLEQLALSMELLRSLVTKMVVRMDSQSNASMLENTGSVRALTDAVSEVMNATIASTDIIPMPVSAGLVAVPRTSKDMFGSWLIPATGFGGPASTVSSTVLPVPVQVEPLESTACLTTEWQSPLQPQRSIGTGSMASSITCAPGHLPSLAS